ncbi:hypothetical protein [Streptomyces sp. NPDC048603]|uniref:hypothetical protein n=1 Tax=Streptomyces sp. NPDC048603 TaxID=3365577 RepID=UPI003722A2BB
MEAALIIFALMLLAFVGLGAYATVKVVGAAKRGVERTVTQARRTVEDTALRAKSLGQVGVAGALAQLRLDLRNSMRATQQALQEGARTDASLQESLSLFEQLSRHGRELDDELKRLEADPDKGRVQAALPELRARTRRVTESADSLRWAAHERARRLAEDDLSVLSDRIGMESDALRDWSRPSTLDEDLAAAASQAQTAHPQPQDRSAEPETRTGPAQNTTALPPSGAAAPYPWQKTPRPEATT